MDEIDPIATGRKGLLHAVKSSNRESEQIKKATMEMDEAFAQFMVSI
jgi:hypothetical protein